MMILSGILVTGGCLDLIFSGGKGDGGGGGGGRGREAGGGGGRLGSKPLGLRT